MGFFLTDPDKSVILRKSIAVLLLKTISIQQFHELLSEAYCVDLNDFLYLVTCDAFGDWWATHGDETIDLTSIDGDIEIDEFGVFFHIDSDPIRLKFIMLRCFSQDEITNLATNNKE